MPTTYTKTCIRQYCRYHTEWPKEAFLPAFKRGTWTRRKIQSECGMHAMWHKTGNTLRVIVNGRQTGSKKVLVLHTNKNFDQQRTNWVMHQYHLRDLE